MEHSSYELSVQLRDAGFPQPVFQRGQTWFKDGAGPGSMRLITHADEQIVRYTFADGQFQSSFPPQDAEGWVYAPTALDILKKLPGWYALHKIDADDQHMWGCEKMAEKVIVSDFYLSALEAAAKRYLSLK